MKTRLYTNLYEFFIHITKTSMWRKDLYSIPSHVMHRNIIWILLMVNFTIGSALSQCSGTVYDPGGSSNYSNNANWTVTYTATSGLKQRISFTSFDVESGNDNLRIYDGPNTSSPVIGNYSGTTLPPNITSTNGTLTLRFTSNGSVTRPGWVATLSCFSPVEICNNGIDDDGDGLTDCSDPDCYLVSNTGGTDTDGDGVDNNCEDDADGDGVNNSLDLDNDNDGILDVNEGCQNFNISGTVGININNIVNNLTYALTGTSVTYNRSGSNQALIHGNIAGSHGESIKFTGEVHDSGIFSATYSNPISALHFKLTDFDELEEFEVRIYDEYNRLYNLATRGVVSKGYLVNQNGNLFAARESETMGGTAVDGDNVADDYKGSVEFYISGKVSKIEIDYYFANSNNGASIRMPMLNYCIRDTDGEGTLDFLDTDSDGDGCADAIEAAGNFTSSDVNINYMLNGSRNANGVPTVALGGQANTNAVINNTLNQCLLVEICDNGIDDDGDGLIDCGDSDCPSCVAETCASGVKLTSQYTSTATGSGVNGIPRLNNFFIPAGNNRIVFVAASFERSHCQSGDNCSSSNTSGTGVGDNFACANLLASSGLATQIQINAAGPSNNITKLNPLTFPDGDLRWSSQFAYAGSFNNLQATFMSREMYYFAFYESEIQSLLNGAPSGYINLTLPNVGTPKDISDEASIVGYTFINAEQTTAGIVRASTAYADNIYSPGHSGNFTLTNSDLDNGQEPNETGDGVLIVAMSGNETYGYNTPSGYQKITNQSVIGSTSNNFTDLNEPDGMTINSFFRNGTSGIINSFSVTSSGPSNINLNGGMAAIFKIESCVAVEICNNGLDDDGDGLIDCADSDCTSNGNADVVISQSGVTNPNNALGAPDGVQAQLWDTNDQMVLDLTDVLSAGNAYTIRWRRDPGSSSNPSISVEESANGSTWSTAVGSPFTFSTTSYFNQTISASTNTRYLRFNNLNTYNVDLDAVSYTKNCVVEICDNGIDDDGDGFIDCLDPDCSGNFSCSPKFLCDSRLYQTIEISGNYWLYELRTQPTMTHIPLANLNAKGIIGGVNSTVFNTNDGYIYTMNMVSPYRLYRIAGDYAVQYIGNIQGLPPSSYMNAGGMGANGKMYLRNQLNADIYELDLSNLSTLNATLKCDFPSIPGVQNNVGDIAYNPSNGKFYGTRDSSNQIIAYDLSNCTSSTINTNILMSTANGAFYISADGTGYGYQNGSGTLLRINLTTGIVDSVGTSIPTVETDGCSCEGIKFNKDVVHSCVVEDSIVVFEYNMFNNWYSDLTNVTFKDTLTHGLIWASEPYDILGGTLGPSAINGNSIADFTITSFPRGQLSFKIKALIPQNYSGSNPNMSQAYLANLPGVLAPYKKSDYPKTPAIDDATPLYINKPLVMSGGNNLCLGSTTTITPSSGGIWTCSNTSVATITNSGLITALAAGNVTFSFTNSTTGCIFGQAAIIIANPTASISGTNTICAGNSTTFTANGGGTYLWNTAATTAAISVSTAGTYTVTVTNASGCTATATRTLTTNANPTASISGTNTICAGNSTTFTASGGGTYLWNTAATTAAISVSTAGTYTVTVTNSSGCTTTATRTLTINANPTPSISGTNTICAGNNTTFSASGGSTYLWSTSATTAAILVSTAGTYTMTVTSAFGCTATATRALTVNANPTASISGTNTICAGGSSTFTASGGVTYLWNNTATTAAIEVSTAGTYTVTVTNSSGCTTTANRILTVNANPSPSISGTNIICSGDSTTFTASGGSSYLWSNSAITAAINVTTAETYTVTVTNAAGCTATANRVLTLNAIPSITGTTPGSRCGVGSVSLSATASAGTINWYTTPSGGVSIGTGNNFTTPSLNTTTSYYIDATFNGCTTGSRTSIEATIHNIPSVSIDFNGSICLTDTSKLSAITSSGTAPFNYSWTGPNGFTGNTQTINITQNGNYYITVVDNNGCSSTTNSFVYQEYQPFIVTLNTEICEGDSINLSVVSGTAVSYLWSANASNAITSNVTVFPTLLSSTYRVTVTNNLGCSVVPEVSILVKAKPIVSVTGPNNICAGTTTTLSPTTGGSWSSNNPSIASVTNAGVVTGLSPGTASFTFTNAATGCISLPTSTITVNAKPIVSLTGQSVVCLGYTTSLSPTSGGTWTSNNLNVISVTNAGLVTGLAPGKVTFTFTESITGCSSSLPADAVTVINCLDPDIHVTFTNTIVYGNVATNDDIPTFGVYGSPLLDHKPIGSIETLTINLDGSYNFTANLAGQYQYRVPVCISPMNAGCPFSELTITVVDKNNLVKTTIANTDFTTMYQFTSTGINTPTSISTLDNDRCLSSLDCGIDINNVSVDIHPSNGSSILTSGAIVYSPNIDFAGQDFLQYKVCNDQNGINCVTSKQRITINALNALNSTVGVDDFGFGFESETIIGNVLFNDSDAEGDIQTVIPQGSPLNKITIPSGSYYIMANGNYEFISNPGFTGPVEIIYSVCDNNSTVFCTKATIKLLILPYFKLSVRVYLEGALINNQGIKGPDNRPLMRDNLRESPFTGLNYIPTKDPYTFATLFTNLSSKFVHAGPGLKSRYNTITNSSVVLGVTGEDAIVDWVFVELRSKSDVTKLLSTRSGLLQRDGDVVDMDGISPLSFENLILDSFYVVVRHRSHLGAMSQKVEANKLIDFTKPTTPVYNFGTSLNNGYDYTGLSQKSNVVFGYEALWAGDSDSNKKVKFNNPNDDLNVLFFEIFFFPTNIVRSINFDFGYGYLQGDFDMNSKAKYENPNDDKNSLFAQLVFYPLNTNLLSNFDFFIEQVPLTISIE